MIEQLVAMKDILVSLQPDVIVLDHSMMVLQQWAENQQIPTVILHTPYYQSGPATGCARLGARSTLELMYLMARRKPLGFVGKARRRLGLDDGNATRIPEGAAEARTAKG